MLTEALAMLATAGGTAVVQAAGKDIWDGFREQLARWFGRGDAEREQAELERLDQTAQALEAARGAEAQRVRRRQEELWQARIESLLESLDGVEREQAGHALGSLLAQAAPRGTRVSAGPGGVATGENMTITANGGSIAAGTIHGGAQIGAPSPPDPSLSERAGPTDPPVPDPPQG
ncbi:hypothetical protein ABZ924_28410 [Streptomyces sp. NPDC046876]|uniref:hypothetical protein n=1 Tax=Streptomyces sp. NPDC046876 TaxID=3155616 RepID=UPI0033C96084